MIKRAVPAVLLVNENFIIATKTVAKAYGVDDLPYVVFPSNMDSMPEGEIIELTEKGFDEVLGKLINPSTVAAHAHS